MIEMDCGEIGSEVAGNCLGLCEVSAVSNDLFLCSRLESV
jgi:hypothetical protein